MFPSLIPGLSNSPNNLQYVGHSPFSVLTPEHEERSYGPSPLPSPHFTTPQDLEVRNTGTR